MPGEPAILSSGARAGYYRALFLAAAVWNALSGGAVLFVLTDAARRREMGFRGAPDTISLQLLATCLFVFGLGYYWVSRDRTHPVIEFLWSNVNYHLEHHLYPSVPYHALPELRRALASDYQAHQSNVENGYGRTALVLLRDPQHFAQK